MKPARLVFLLLIFLGFPKFAFASISLNISNVTIKDDYYIVTVTASGLATTSGCFVQGMFRHPTVTDHFGYTWTRNGVWFKYDSTPEKDFVINNFVELKNEVAVDVLVKPDISNPKTYLGPGDYLFEFRRYTDTGTASSHYSNEVSINISAPQAAQDTPTPTLTPTATTTTTSTPTPTQVAVTTSTPTKTSTPTPNSTKTLTATPTPTVTKSITPTVDKITSAISSISGTVLSESTNSADFPIQPTIELASPAAATITQNKLANYKNIFVLGVVVSTASGGVLYFRHRKG